MTAPSDGTCSFPSEVILLNMLRIASSHHILAQEYLQSFSKGFLILSGDAFVPDVEDRRDRQSGDNVPDTPPCGDHEHSAVGRETGEYGGPQQEHESEPGILDTGLYGQGPAVTEGDLESRSHPESYSQCHKVVDKHNNEYVFDAFEECIEVSCKG